LDDDHDRGGACLDGAACHDADVYFLLANSVSKMDGMALATRAT
jgi:hypothetical protein